MKILDDFAISIESKIDYGLESVEKEINSEPETDRTKLKKERHERMKRIMKDYAKSLEVLS